MPAVSLCAKCLKSISELSFIFYLNLGNIGDWADPDGNVFIFIVVTRLY